MNGAFLRNTLSLLLILFSLVLNLGCSRKESQVSQIHIKTPPSGSLFKNSLNQSKTLLPIDKYKVCYAVNVESQDIPSNNSTCGLTKGLLSSFVEEGGSLIINVPVGLKRNFSIISFVSSNLSENCPNWEQSCTKGQECKMFKVGETLDVNVSGNEMVVNVDVMFPGFDKNVVSTSDSPLFCEKEVHFKLLNSGLVLDKSGQVIALNSNQESQTSLFTLENSVYSSHSSGFLSPLPSQYSDVINDSILSSITSDPVSGKIYGLNHSGTIFEISKVNGTIINFSSTNCPLSFCKVPIWFQSISIGLASAVYGLDHGGGLWKVESNGQVTKKTTDVGPHVKQVTFF